jgi:hypothetical protein
VRVTGCDNSPEPDTSIVALYADGVEIELTPGQKALIRHAIETGRLNREEEAVQAGLSLFPM